MKIIPHRRIVSALTAGMLVASAGPAGAKSAAEVFAEVAPSVVVVLALDDNGETIAQGSGVVVGKNEVATNCHVIEDANSVAVRQAADSGGGETYRMDSRILTRDGERDLCLLFVEDLSVPPAAPVAAMGAAKGLAVGEEVYAIGAPKGLELSISRGIVSQLRGIHGKRAAPLVQTDAAISPGSSGGGLFNADGELVGITTFKWKGESLNFAIPAEWVGELWERTAALVALRGTPSPRTENFKVGELNADSQAYLFIAAYENDIKAVQWLIANGAEVNAKDNDGDTPLHWAAFQNSSEAAAVLLANGAEVNAKENDGETPLHWAASQNSSEAAAALLANGAEVNAKENDDWTPLHFAARSNSPEAAAVLVSNGAEINAKNNYGTTPLHDAARSNSPEVVAVLVSNGADINAKDKRGMTPLFWAAAENRAEAAAVLIDNDAEVNAEDNIGLTPLHSAALMNLPKTAAMLIDNGANINAKGNYGSTPLNVAAIRNSLEAAAVLIDNGANVNVKDISGFTPLDWAIKKGHSKMRSFLHKHGGRCNKRC